MDRESEDVKAQVLEELVGLMDQSMVSDLAPEEAPGEGLSVTAVEMEAAPEGDPPASIAEEEMDPQEMEELLAMYDEELAPAPEEEPDPTSVLEEEDEEEKRKRSY